MTTATIKLENGRLMVSGDLNFANVVNLAEQSRPLLAECNTLQIDLSQVSSSSSAGLALLLEWLKYAKKTAKPITFFSLPNKLSQIAAAADVDKALI